MLDTLVSDLIAHTRSAIGESGVQSVEDVRKFARRLFAFSPAVDENGGRSRTFSIATCISAPCWSGTNGRPSR